jgi:hypothetical protein
MITDKTMRLQDDKEESREHQECDDQPVYNHFNEMEGPEAAIKSEPSKALTPTSNPFHQNHDLSPATRMKEEHSQLLSTGFQPA